MRRRYARHAYAIERSEGVCDSLRQRASSSNDLERARHAPRAPPRFDVICETVKEDTFERVLPNADVFYWCES